MKKVNFLVVNKVKDLKDIYHYAVKRNGRKTDAEGAAYRASLQSEPLTWPCHCPPRGMRQRRNKFKVSELRML